MSFGGPPDEVHQDKRIAAAVSLARLSIENPHKIVDEDFKKLGIRHLPRNLLQAVDYLKKDKLAEKVLGKVMLNSYVNYKKDEWERYHQAVTDWEVKEYLRLY